jgi:hypothetical protein
MIEQFDSWLGASAENMTLFAALSTLFFVMGLLGLAIARWRVGKPDERSVETYSRITGWVLCLQAFAVVLFISQMTPEIVHYRQVLIGFEAIAVLLAGIGAGIEGFRQRIE